MEKRLTDFVVPIFGVVDVERRRDKESELDCKRALNCEISDKELARNCSWRLGYCGLVVGANAGYVFLLDYAVKNLL
ncbi:hypothetical protein HOE04_03795 [archaeon]|nr:hypothetical protein [archaeon]